VPQAGVNRSGRRRRDGIALRCALPAAAYAALSAATWGNPHSPTIRLAALTGAALYAAWCCSAAARRHRGGARRPWLLLTVVAGGWVVGDLVWLAFAIRHSEPPFPSAADAAYLTALVAAAAAVTLLVPIPERAASRVRLALDAVLVGLALLIVTWVAVIGPSQLTPGALTAWSGLALAYPVGDVLVATLALVAASRGGGARPARLVGLAMIAASVSDTAFALLTIRGAAALGRLTDVGWLLAMLLLAEGARHSTPARPATRPDAAPTSAQLAAPYLPMGVAVLAVVLVDDARHGATGTTMLVMVSALVALALLRQYLASVDTARLSRTLEGTVRTRTAELARSERTFRQLFDRNPQPMWVYDRATLGFLEVNAAAVRAYGFSREEFLGMSILDIRPDEDRALLLDSLAKAAAGMKHAGLWRHRVADGRVIDVDVSVHGLPFAGRDAALVLARDVTEQRHLERELRHQALHDPLTNLANRGLLRDRIEQALAEGGGRHVTVMLLDLDGFKAINDSLGHTAGDTVLAAVADRLRRQSRPGDTVARLGGDEFALVLDASLDADGVRAVADRILAAIAAPIATRGGDVLVTASLGIAVSAGENADELLRNADIAMYVAKEQGRGTHRTFDQAHHDALVERTALEADLHRALAAHQLEVHYQPTVALGDGTIIGAEALVRWRHPERGLVPPAQFVGLAESTGMIVTLGRQVLDEACRWAASQPDDLGVRVAVNLSARQLQEGALVDDVVSCLRRSGLAPERLTLEITETALMRDPTTAGQRLHALKNLGITLALDDFGTGYSSLSYLHRFPVDVVKIDKSFVDDIHTNERSRRLVRTVIDLARSLGISSHAEGVETQAQASFLRDAGCDLAQGYLFGRPVPGPQLAQDLGTWRALTHPPSDSDRPTAHG